MARLFSLLRFWRREDGLLSTEAALIMPMLLFAYAGLFTIYDAFRVQNLNVRGSYTLSDLLSRESQCIDAEYIEGLNGILSVLTQSTYPTILRVSVISFDDDTEDYELEWSSVDGGGDDILPLTGPTLAAMESKIPVMSSADIAILVETWSGFVPMMDFGLEAFYFENFVVTRPRFVNQLHWDDGTNPICAVT